MRGAIAAGDERTAQAGAVILENGGNAFDAAIAAMFAAPICEPAITSLGGGGFCLAYKDTPMLYDFFVDVPPKRIPHPEFYPIYVDFKTTIQEFHIGAGSIATPGVIKGIFALYKEYASMPLQELIQPAVEYAKNGIYLSSLQAGFLRLLEPIFSSTEESKKIYFKNGHIIDEHTLFTNEAYASFLQRLASEGEELFYKGEIAQKIDSLLQENEGILRKEDLQKYKVQKREPIHFPYKEYEIFTNPPPSSGGILIAFTLELLRDEDLGDFGSMEHIEKLIESLKITADFRKEQIDEYIHQPSLANILQDEKIINGYKKSFASRINLWGNTTHISVIDKNKHFASVTTTNGEASGYVIPGTGVMLNNMLGEEDLNPHGFFTWPAYVRLPSMMAPTAVFYNNEPLLILGSAGSNRIRSAIIQTIINYLVFKKDIRSAIELPRIHFEKDEVFIEPGFSKEHIQQIKKLFNVYEFDEKSLFFGGVQAVTKDFEGWGDPRRGGAFLRV